MGGWSPPERLRNLGRVSGQRHAVPPVQRDEGGSEGSANRRFREAIMPE